jgi:hypothetical protein
MYRRQVERLQKEIESILGTILKSPTGLQIETVSSSSSFFSLAEEESNRVRDREERILQSSKEHPAVRTTLQILKGTIEQIRILDKDEEMLNTEDDNLHPPQEADNEEY